MAAKKVKTVIRKTQIVAAALEVISRKGLSGLTIASIAREVGIANGNIYRHFHDKEALLEAVISDVGASLEAMALDACRRQRHARPRLQAIFLGHLTFLRHNTGVPRLVFSDDVYASRKTLSRSLKYHIEKYLAIVKEVLRQGVRERSFDPALDVHAASSVFIGLIQSVALQWFLFGSPAVSLSGGSKIWKIYLHGILRR